MLNGPPRPREGPSSVIPNHDKTVKTTSETCTILISYPLATLYTQFQSTHIKNQRSKQEASTEWICQTR
jgi:hypothetical protein